MAIRIGTDMVLSSPAHETDRESEQLRKICAGLRDQARHAQIRINEAHEQAERLIDKIELEESLLDDLRRQRQRTGDDGFDSDIAQQERNINNLRPQVERAREIAHRWEGEADMLERQMNANNCDDF